MKPYIVTILLFAWHLHCHADEKIEIIKKAYPWIYESREGIQYEAVSFQTIQDYCNKHQLELSFWHEEHQKRLAEYSGNVSENAKSRPEDGLVSGVKEMLLIKVNFFINKRLSEGWRVSATFADSILFEKIPPKDDKATKAEK